jgi:hypothetical protein
MAITNKWYGKTFEAAFNKEIDINSDDIRAMVIGSGYTFNQDTHKYKSDITGEVSGTGYTAGGKTLTTPVVSYDAANNRFIFDADDVSWPLSTLNAGANIPLGLVIYDNTPATDATRPLICYVDFGGGLPTTNGTLQVTFDANGIVRVTIS